MAMVRTRFRGFGVLNAATEMESVAEITCDPSNATHVTRKVSNFAFGAHNDKNLRREKTKKIKYPSQRPNNPTYEHLCSQ